MVLITGMIRGLLWNALSTTSMAVVSQVPWIILGDFNIVKDASEKWGGLGIDSLGSKVLIPALII